MLKFRENLRIFRKMNSLTQSKFAQMLNVKLSDMNADISYNNKSISMWEKGERLPDNPLVWLAIADLIGVTIDVLMRGDLSEISEVACDISASNNPSISLKASLAESYLTQVSNGVSDKESVFNLYANIDSLDNENNSCHGMACFLSSVKSEDGYHGFYNLMSNGYSRDYILSLSKRDFIGERDFVMDIIEHGGREVIATNDQLSKLWKGYFESFDNALGFNVEVLYDNDCNHILCMVEYVISATEKEVAQYISSILTSNINLNSDGLSNVLGKLVLANNKQHIGIRYAREKWKI